MATSTQAARFILPNAPTCIVACSSAVARCWLSEDRQSDWDTLAEFEHEAARHLEQEFQADKPGRSFDSFGRGRHAMSMEHSAREQSNIRFADTVATFLNEAFVAGRYRFLVILAEPKILGMLRGKLSDTTLAAVVFEAPKNLANFDARDVKAYFA